jgi:two-component system sensor histidine kinase KdpD
MVHSTAKRVDLKVLINEALATLDVGDQDFDIDVPDDLPALNTDGTLLKRVIVNVVDNAIRFGPVSKPIRLSAGTNGQFIELLVIDRGPGIDEAQRARLIAPGGQIYDEETAAGIGLTVCAGFLKPLGGELRFEDTPGGGLTVCIELLKDMTSLPSQHS